MKARKEGWKYIENIIYMEKLKRVKKLHIAADVHTCTGIGESGGLYSVWQEGKGAVDRRTDGSGAEYDASICKINCPKRWRIFGKEWNSCIISYSLGMMVAVIV